MSEKILLSTYLIKITDGINEQLIDQFNGSNDFFEQFNKFSEDLFINIKRQKDLKNKNTLLLTFDELPKFDIDNREVYGFFLSGISKDDFDIRGLSTNKSEFKFQRDKHAEYRELFFYLKLPTSKKVGFLVLQRKAHYGIKILLRDLLNKYMVESGYLKYKIEINNVLHSKVFKRMMDNGRLKKVDFVKRGVPNSYEEYVNNDYLTNNSKGTIRTSITSSMGLTEDWKSFVSELWNNSDDKAMYEFPAEKEFKEVEFELEYKGKQKKFYIYEKDRTQPDVDVTDDIIFVDGKPTIESLVLSTKELMIDFFKFSL